MVVSDSEHRVRSMLPRRDLTRFGVKWFGGGGSEPVLYLQTSTRVISMSWAHNLSTDSLLDSTSTQYSCSAMYVEVVRKTLVLVTML